jgi:hypothetical protein
MRFRYTAIDSWPPLAWLACLRRHTPIEVFHGSGVETSPEWFCEAIWDGPYASGDFDAGDVVFGSGGRYRGDSVTFVSSASTVDRLHSLEVNDTWWVSNSLVCLLAAAGAEVDPTYAGYFNDFKTISRGITRYTRTLATSAGPVRLTYYLNLAWDGTRLREQPKAGPHRVFASFAAYRSFLDTSLSRLIANMAAPARGIHYLPLGTMSSGYDSAAVAALARAHGLREAIAFDRSSSGEPDSGEVIANVLGLKLTIVARDAWRAMTLPEVPFIAADAKGEDVYFKGAEPQLARRVLLTGFHGDRVWDKRRRAASEDLVRGDQSGLSLSEYRLWTGFLHCPLPFAGVRQVRDINAISRSPELVPWDIGSHYSRPICRRILEEAGVPRHAFGLWKKTASVLFFWQDGFLSPASLNDYRAWLCEHAPAWAGRGLKPPALPADGTNPRRRPTWAVAQFLDGIGSIAPRQLWFVRSAARAVANFGGGEWLFRHLFPWALERAKRRYDDATLKSLVLEAPGTDVRQAHG